MISPVLFLSLPLCLTVQLLSPCQSRLAIRFRSSSFRWLTILQGLVTQSSRDVGRRTSCSLFVSQTLEESKLRQRTFGFAAYRLPLPCTLHVRRKSSQATSPAAAHTQLRETLGRSTRSGRRRVLIGSAGWRVGGRHGQHVRIGPGHITSMRHGVSILCGGLRKQKEIRDVYV